MNTNIKNWYVANNEDDLGLEINDKITFQDLYNALENGDDVYELLGVDDSLIREICFEKLAELMNVDYDVIYKLWLSK